MKKYGFGIGDMVITTEDALLPCCIGKIVGLSVDDYPGTTEDFIVDFGDDEGTCTVNQNDMKIFAI